MVAALQSSINPARALGLPNPALQTGSRADLVVLDDQLAVVAVLCGGAWVDELVSGA
jgi:N-acetylglucosamine-6-phosphate deacetylase